MRKEKKKRLNNVRSTSVFAIILLLGMPKTLLSSIISKYREKKLNIS